MSTLCRSSFLTQRSYLLIHKEVTNTVDRLLVPTAVFTPTAFPKHKHLETVRVRHSYYETLH